MHFKSFHQSQGLNQNENHFSRNFLSCNRAFGRIKPDADEMHSEQRIDVRKRGYRILQRK
jgi:hypothetical protein